MKKLVGITLLLVAVVVLVFFLSKQGLRIVPKVSVIAGPSESPSPSATPTATQTASGDITIRIQKVKLTSPSNAFTLKEGATVTFHITADANDVFHVLGYEKSVTLQAGKEATLSFVADKKGVYAFELQNQHIQLGTITVAP